MQAFTKQVENFLLHAEKTNRLRSLEAPPENLIDLCSNDYLGLAKHRRIKDALKTGVDLYGGGSTASRLVRGHRGIFAQVERQTAEWLGGEAALFFANGYAANVGALSAICDSSYVAFIDRLAHASLVDGVRLSGAQKVYFRHNDMQHLGELLAKHRATKAIIITESLFSMDGDMAPAGALIDLKTKFDALLYIDDAHGIGVYGDAGCGLSPREADFRVITFGKALGLEGAAIVCSDASRSYLLHNARTFVFSTAPMPAILHAAAVAIELVKGMQGERERLQQVSATIRNAVKDAARMKSSSHIVPLICESEAAALELAGRFAAAGFHTRAIRPPTVKESRVRLSLNSNLTAEQAAQIAGLIGAA
ncbi:aminotransferase class I/II-fold pyridoxal phosphate-dependent enzyme [Turneriella parva]|uniref:Aminotransferase class I and II n=1 Tax=Turneriella parva (strain ATCC BAA-1111 / DSM 21527 / NCTC 11395 / H) TaxID=869212 RepID=I4BAM7_TURPD|nr:8-amino-7-oxononanoate synthase [Turneriella parva]AFM14334.1 aminotransferase class I and II [Turneriella parva DSM 21527]